MNYGEKSDTNIKSQSTSIEKILKEFDERFAEMFFVDLPDKENPEVIKGITKMESIKSFLLSSIDKALQAQQKECDDLCNRHCNGKLEAQKQELREKIEKMIKDFYAYNDPTDLAKLGKFFQDIINLIKE